MWSRLSISQSFKKVRECHPFSCFSVAELKLQCRSYELNQFPGHFSQFPFTYGQKYFDIIKTTDSETYLMRLQHIQGSEIHF